MLTRPIERLAMSLRTVLVRWRGWPNTKKSVTLARNRVVDPVPWDLGWAGRGHRATRVAAALAASSVLTAGCGSSGSLNDFRPLPTNSANVATLVMALEATSSDNGKTYELEIDNVGLCRIRTVLPTSTLVRLHASGGKLVATNSSKTAGLILDTADSRSCAAALTGRLNAIVWPPH